MTTGKMEASELQAIAVQMLQNYQRCGIRYVARGNANQLPEEVREHLAAAQTATLAERSGGATTIARAGSNATSSPSVAAVDRSSYQTSSVSQLANTSALSAAPPVTQSSTERPTVAAPRLITGTGSWNLPVVELSDRQQQLSALNAQVDACRLCSEIVTYRQRTVFGTGDMQPTICFMGEAPGADEDRTGQPFVGKAGQLLTKIIAAMKLSREEVYILNALKCRPPQNRTPVAVEIDSCRSFVENQLEILQPKYIVCLGAVAVRSLLRDEGSIGRLRGKFHSYKGAKVVVTYHPSYLLRQESAKRMVWEDMQMLMRDMGTLA